MNKMLYIFLVTHKTLLRMCGWMKDGLKMQVNGMLLHEKKVFVGTFVPRKEREKEMGEKVEILFTLKPFLLT